MMQGHLFEPPLSWIAIPISVFPMLLVLAVWKLSWNVGRIAGALERIADQAEKQDES